MNYCLVPPGGAVNTLFDSAMIEEFDFLVLFQNQYPVDPDAPIRYDTTARGADRRYSFCD